MYPYKDKIRCPHSLRDEKLAPMPRTEHAIKVNRQEYYAIITHMGAQIGRILDSPKNPVLRTAPTPSTPPITDWGSDTMVCSASRTFTSTAPAFLSSFRVPVFRKASKSKLPSTCRASCLTLLALAGLDKPKHVEFQGVLPFGPRRNKKSPYKEIYGLT